MTANRTMRCLHIISGDLWAGAEVATYHLLVALAATRKIDLHVLLLNDGELSARLRAAGVEVTVVPESQTPSLELLQQVRGMARSWRPDVVHTHRFKEHLIGALAAGPVRALHVRTAHGRAPAGSVHARTRIALSLDRGVRVLRGALWIAVSDDLAAEVAGWRNRVLVVRNGLPSATPEPLLQPLEEAFATAEPARYVGFVGRLEQVKRPDRFLRLVSRLPPLIGGRQVRGVVIGEGQLGEALRADAVRLGVADRVRFLGHHAAAERIIGALDCLVLCSDHEGHPMVLLEAMRAGTPVATTQVGGIPEVLGSSQYVVPAAREQALAGAVQELLADEVARARWSAWLRDAFRTRYSIEAAAREVLTIYRGEKP